MDMSVVVCVQVIDATTFTAEKVEAEGGDVFDDVTDPYLLR